MSYVDKIKKGNKIFDIQDARISDPSALGLEVIDWDGERDFTEEEINKLVENKACVMLNEDPDFTYYYVVHSYKDAQNNKSVDLCYFAVYDDGINNGEATSLMISGDGSFAKTDYYFSEFKGTKLYKHEVTFTSGDGDTIRLELTSYINTFNTILSLEQYAQFHGSVIDEDDPSAMKGIIVAIYNNQNNDGFLIRFTTPDPTRNDVEGYETGTISNFTNIVIEL